MQAGASLTGSISAATVGGRASFNASGSALGVRGPVGLNATVEFSVQLSFAGVVRTAAATFWFVVAPCDAGKACCASFGDRLSLCTAQASSATASCARRAASARTAISAWLRASRARQAVSQR